MTDDLIGRWLSCDAQEDIHEIGIEGNATLARGG
eukprot:CAMPEP_0116856180 /NCGR_PEP_ID=MMETSP0418-20121206/19744_1 /TAXON_ID=1158023 /ORGANISM="Astrosyne radiata, Strain 13vi08-1A" /LENGTH=33 /DNA_ID= /DNA_START= /DNA_END= /DNA_ORIENTATION=